MKATAGYLLFLLVLVAAVTDVGAKGREEIIHSIFTPGILLLFQLSCPLPRSLHFAGVLREAFQLALPLMDVLFVFFWPGQLELSVSTGFFSVRPCALTVLCYFFLPSFPPPLLFFKHSLVEPVAIIISEGLLTNVPLCFAYAHMLFTNASMESETHFS